MNIAIGMTMTFLVALIVVSATAYTVESGNVVVERTLGEVNHQEVGQGLNFKMPILTRTFEFSAKEIPVDFEDLRPKAGDNLTLQDLDVSVFYQANASSISELMVKYAGTSERGEDGALLPAYGLVMREARSAIYEQVATIDSLELHRQRDIIADLVLADLQSRLELSDPGIFTITRVVIRALNTDPSIEEAIQIAVQAEKELEAKQVQVEIARQDALIEIERARGIAEANNIINSSLTAEYLQHEINVALQSFATNGGGTVVIPANMEGFNLLLGTDTLRQSQSELVD
ncbi:MAG: hypothetical protein F4Y89_10370 [Gammaproteobacteria bacterium]|nr:hypothetical protein [Gammaproteobacteria bacterium]MXY90924.1 hypothetical protein [Gammaproteobacteria bacterium]MYE28766.1 hypothetical protein [Gammaproteobacteria bacterium]MYG97126.1 hypothetical protein [Gammaproteobacteria bacterium]